MPASRIYGPRVEAECDWPFIRYGVPITAPFRASCTDGSDVTVAIHAFSKAESEDEASNIAAAVAAAVDGAILTLPGGNKARARWTGSQVIQDAGEADAWHAFASFDIRAVT